MNEPIPSTPVSAPAPIAAPAPVPAPIMSTGSAATPKDFFLWLGAIIALYASVASLIALLFEYISVAYPDPLAYSDGMSDGVRFAMAMLIVTVPTTVLLFRQIRKGIMDESAKAALWIRRWGIMLTLFLAGATLVIDLITVVNYFLSGELTQPFLLKAAVVLLIAGGVFVHFLADAKGYWMHHPRRAQAVGAGVIVITVLTILAGFIIVGTPAQMRAMRLDQQRVSDLQRIQSEVVSVWQAQGTLPESLTTLQDPLTYFTLPMDPETQAMYEYSVTGPRTFSLCGTFSAPTRDLAPGSSYLTPGEDSFVHGEGRTCFARTIDPAKFPRTKDLVPVRGE